MPELIPVLDKETILRKVDEVARQISSDYCDSDLVIIGVLKGAFIFMADLVRRLDIRRFSIDFVRLASYGSASASSGKISLLKDIETDIRGKDVLIIEDILDTGRTLNFLHQHIAASAPRSIETCVLIEKSERRATEVHVKYICHKVQSGFLVGYGLDFDETYRNLPAIFNLKF
ncbi:MAG: hypoxanthine phosphoribosyltransferase [Desulfatitalea sp.]|nr:hypoxanthine phosphoribosyltransferase [Desulfatitalea sp.]NNJ99685.1 hypoxanthine phosphoribosyltransferase [Desulfatitalea sp.]